MTKSMQIIFPFSEYLGELIVMVIDLARSTAAKAKNQAQLEKRLHTSLDYVLNYSPLQYLAHNAAKIGTAWDMVYAPAEETVTSETETEIKPSRASLELARHIYKLLEIIFIVTEDAELQPLMMGLQELLRPKKENSLDEVERASLIFAIEYEPQEKAIAAYTAFIEKFGPDTPLYVASEVLVVSAKYIARFYNFGFIHQIGELSVPLKVIANILRTDAEVRSSSLNILIPNLLGKIKTVLITHKLQKIMRGKTLDKNVLQQITLVKRIKHFGIGHGEIVEV